MSQTIPSFEIGWLSYINDIERHLSRPVTFKANGSFLMVWSVSPYMIFRLVFINNILSMLILTLTEKCDFKKV